MFLAQVLLAGILFSNHLSLSPSNSQEGPDKAVIGAHWMSGSLSHFSNISHLLGNWKEFPTFTIILWILSQCQTKYTDNWQYTVRVLLLTCPCTHSSNKPLDTAYCGLGPAPGTGDSMETTGLQSLTTPGLGRGAGGKSVQSFRAWAVALFPRCPLRADWQNLRNGLQNEYNLTSRQMTME